jgi:hypothetical protein
MENQMERERQQYETTIAEMEEKSEKREQKYSVGYQTNSYKLYK